MLTTAYKCTSNIIHPGGLRDSAVVNIRPLFNVTMWISFFFCFLFFCWTWEELLNRTSRGAQKIFLFKHHKNRTKPKKVMSAKWSLQSKWNIYWNGDRGWTNDLKWQDLGHHNKYEKVEIPISQGNVLPLNIGRILDIWLTFPPSHFRGDIGETTTHTAKVGESTKEKL